MEDEHASHLDITSSAVLFTDEEIQDPWTDFVTFLPATARASGTGAPQATMTHTITTATTIARIVILITVSDEKWIIRATAAQRLRQKAKTKSYVGRQTAPAEEPSPAFATISKNRILTPAVQQGAPPNTAKQLSKEALTQAGEHGGRWQHRGLKQGQDCLGSDARKYAKLRAKASARKRTNTADGLSLRFDFEYFGQGCCHFRCYCPSLATTAVAMLTTDDLLPLLAQWMLWLPLSR